MLTGSSRSSWRCPKKSSRSIQTSAEVSDTPVYVCYPSYTLPDLRFLLKKKDPGSGVNEPEVFLLPQAYKVPRREKKRPQGSKRPLSCNDIESLRTRDLSHVKDWPSLEFLLPKEVRSILRGVKEGDKDPEPVILRRSRPSRGGLTQKGHKGHRFSLQEPIPEILEITTEINRNLDELKFLNLREGSSSGGGQGSGQGSTQGHDIPETQEMSSTEESGSTRVPTNTPKMRSYSEQYQQGTRGSIRIQIDMEEKQSESK
jgi:hypothetical protein